MPKKSLVWLASYPKSGNTWTRVFLANYLFNRREPMPINEVHRVGMGDSIPQTYARVAGGGPFDPGDHKRALTLRPRVLRAIVANNADVNFVKTHNARTTAFGTELVPTALTRSAVYILRHPLDVACSYARHYAMTPEKALEAMGREDNIVVGNEASVPQYLGSWAGHLRSWTRHRDFPVLVLRYEDLLADPEEGFARVLELIGMPIDRERLSRAVRFSDFEELSSQEAKNGFIEKSPAAERFFHQGGSGRWREVLSPDAAAAFAAANAKTMEARGYAL
ncbi:MAG: sulfotransferase domain-containing protein [Paracoccaceae bacterium]